MTNLQEDIIKIIVVGDSRVGKTSFIQRYVNNHYIKDYQSTIFADFVTKILNEHGGQRVRLKLQFWDISGQDRFASGITRKFYDHARGCIIMFDQTNFVSFENVRKWKKSVESNIPDDGSPPIPFLLVGNKFDLSPRVIAYAQIEQRCQELKFVQWTETSVKDGTNVNEAVSYLLDVILNRSPKVYAESEYEIIDSIHLVGYEHAHNRKSCKICR